MHRRLFPCLIALALGSLSGHAQEPPPWPVLKPAPDSEPLPGTDRLEMTGDISRQLIEANDRFLDERIAVAAREREGRWQPDHASPEAYEKSVAPHRERLAKMLGLHRDPRPDPAEAAFEYYSPDGEPAAVAKDFVVRSVRWRAFGDVSGEGLLIEPVGGEAVIRADVIAIPDADQTPEAIAGLTPSDATAFAWKLAQAGCRVLVPSLIDRAATSHGLTAREWLHRPAFELGRHLLGYELNMILSGAACLRNTQSTQPRPVGVIGWGEGGLLALHAGALDPAFAVTGVSGYFGPREGLWRQPAEHTIFGLLETFGDAEIAALVAPRPLIIESGTYPRAAYRATPDGQLEHLTTERAKQPGKPGIFPVPTPEGVAAETARYRRLTGSQAALTAFSSESALSDDTLVAFAKALGLSDTAAMAKPREFTAIGEATERIASRRERQVTSIDQHNQRVLVNAAAEREVYFKDLKTDNLDAFSVSIEAYREKFRTEVIGDFGVETIEPRPRSRKYQEGPKTISYEVVLDVLPGVFAYGILTLPKDLDLAGGEKRPVVVCQHGLEGTPQDVIGEAAHQAYSAFATRLAERGFITFAPQNGYKYFDLFRMQQFKAQSIGKTLFSIIIPQHRQITDWLASLPYVADDRIGFYGLSYGGKSAMRIPPLVPRYCLSICSADFNEWVWKNAATDPRSLRYSYANKGEYEIFEWDLGGTFNYAEMAALICPRPFMVERGHFDGVAPDDKVAHEFAKVRFLYQGKLGIGDRCEIEWFPGPHKINGVATYDFLHRHLRWPKP